jgi:hypothetical protein
VADVAWRTIPDPNGGVIMLHQLAALDPVCPSRGGYSGTGLTGPIVQIAVSAGTASGGMHVVASGGGLFPLGGPTALAVDVAASPTADELAIAIAGAVPDNGMQRIVVAHRNGTAAMGTPSIAGQVVAVAYTYSGQLLAVTRDPLALYVDVLNSNRFVFLANSPHDTGHEVFHAGTGGGLACAGCHPEGGDDGRVWTFAGVGPRRTQNLRGGLLATAPFHWDGRFSDVSPLLEDVFHGRMSGPRLAPDQSMAVRHWLDTIPPIPHGAPLDQAAVARGAALFNDAVIGCTSCHAGAHFTNNATVDVGTGGAFQVPSLVGVAFRAPYMHSGCVSSLLDRFWNPCAGGESHGQTRGLSGTQLGDLVSYLETL